MTGARTLLDEVLSGEWPSEERLAAAVRWPEGQHLEFKQAFEKRHGVAAAIRKEVSAFANSEGGLLVLGVENESRALSDWPRYGGAPGEQWVVDVSGSLLYRLARLLQVREDAINGGLLCWSAWAAASDSFPFERAGKKALRSERRVLGADPAIDRDGYRAGTALASEDHVPLDLGKHRNRDA